MIDEHKDEATFLPETEYYAITEKLNRHLEGRAFIASTEAHVDYNRDFGDESDHCACTDIHHQPDAHDFLI